MKKESIKKRKRHGDLQKKILLILVGGFVLGSAHSPRQYSRTLKALKKEWDNINEHALRRSIRPLYKTKLVGIKINPDGTETFFLTDRGKGWALTYQLEQMTVDKPRVWDKKWRVVMFDIPEKRATVRKFFRDTLHSLGFKELQKSVFVHPYPCIDQIEYITEHHQIGRHVRFMVVEAIDNEAYLKKLFSL